MNSSGFLSHLLFFLLLLICKCELQIGRNTKVAPRCGSQLISIEITFDPLQLPNQKFTDWIVVGVSGRPECRLRGNGETKYVIEIAVLNDPCLTQIPSPNVFQNRIRIGKNPVVISEGDQSVTVKCVYGLPTVETLDMPVIHPIFNIDNSQQPAGAGLSTQTSGLINNNNGLLGRMSMFEKTKDNGQEAVPSLSSNDETRSGIPSDFQPTSKNVDESSRNLLLSTVRNDNFGRNSDSNQDTFGQNAIIANNNFETTPSLSGSQQGIDSSINGSTSQNRRFSFRLLSIIILLVLIIVILLFLLCLYAYLKRRKEETNRRSLIDGITSSEGRSRKRNTSWWTEKTSEDYSGIGEPTHANNESQPKSENVTATVMDRRGVKSFIPKIGESNPRLASVGDSRDISRRSTAASDPKFLPVSRRFPPMKSYTSGEYENPRYAYATETFNEKEVDVGNDARKRKEVKDVINQKSYAFSNLESINGDAVSSYKSITEIVHAAETANRARDVSSSREKGDVQILVNCVNNIRGFGYKRLTEQEMGRWKNLILCDYNLRSLLMSSKSVAEIENIFEMETYKYLFTLTKWHEIAQCVHKELTNSLDKSNSQSQLQLFVGNVQTDW